MKIAEAEKIIRQYCTKHRIRLFYPDRNPDRNEGGQSRRTIWLGEFDDADCLVAAFFHEVGHIIDGRKKLRQNHFATIFERELRAWTFGLEEMHNFGIRTDAKAIGYISARLSRYAAKEIDAALATPARNCDVGTAQEQIDRFHEFCHSNRYYIDEFHGYDCRSDCPIGKIVDRDNKFCDNCWAAWAQMPFAPAAERKGENK